MLSHRFGKLLFAFLLPVLLWPAAAPLSVCAQSFPHAALQQTTPAAPPGGASTASSQSSPRSPSPTQSVEEGIVRGQVKSGTTPLPGVTITAINTLTGKRYTTVTDVRGIYAMRIPKYGRYIVRVELSAFAGETKEVLLTAQNREQTLDYSMELESRSRQRAFGRAGGGQNAAAMRALGALAQLGGAESATLDNGQSGVSLAGAAQSSDIATESVAIQGQTGTVNPFAEIDQSQLQQRLQDLRAQNDSSRSPGQGGRGGGGFRGGRVGGGGMGGGGGMAGFFRRFNPTQPHGSVFYRVRIPPSTLFLSP